MKRVSKKRSVIAILLFVVYAVILSYLLFFSSAYGRTSETGYRYNLKPFLEIKRALLNVEAVGWHYVILNIGGNILAFMPAGFLIPAMAAKKQNVFTTGVFVFFLSFLAETIQLCTKTGAFDVDDLILNTLGGVLGYVIYKAAALVRKK